MPFTIPSLKKIKYDSKTAIVVHTPKKYGSIILNVKKPVKRDTGNERNDDNKYLVIVL